MQRTTFAIRHKSGLWQGPHVLTTDIWTAVQYKTPEEAAKLIGCLGKRAHDQAYEEELSKARVESERMNPARITDTVHQQIVKTARAKGAEAVVSYEIVKLDVTINMTTVRAKPAELGERPLDL